MIGFFQTISGLFQTMIALCLLRPGMDIMFGIVRIPPAEGARGIAKDAKPLCPVRAHAGCVARIFRMQSDGKKRLKFDLKRTSNIAHSPLGRSNSALNHNLKPTATFLTDRN